MLEDSPFLVTADELLLATCGLHVNKATLETTDRQIFIRSQILLLQTLSRYIKIRGMAENWSDHPQIVLTQRKALPASGGKAYSVMSLLRSVQLTKQKALSWREREATLSSKARTLPTITGGNMKGKIIYP